MKEIKFRAWNKEKNIMVYNDEDGSADYFDGVCCSDVQIINLTFKSNYNGYEWMQYTGLKDKNGKEIYEGDILKDDRGLIYEIVWGNDLLWLAKTKERHCNCYCPKGISKRAEVIGNIYEDKNLLEEQMGELV